MVKSIKFSMKKTTKTTSSKENLAIFDTTATSSGQV